MTGVWITVVVFVVAGIICCICSGYIEESAKDFEANCQKTTATVVGYRIVDESSKDGMRVKFFDGEEEITREVAAVTPSKRLAIGTEIKIAYQKGECLGHKYVKTRWIKDESKSVVASDYRLVKVLLVIGALLILMGAVIIRFWEIL